MDCLPTELLDLILDFVEINRQTFNHGYQYEAFYRDFHALTLTSKNLHRLAQPRLYRQFQSLHRGRGVVRLVRTLCENPKLSQHIKVIDVAPSVANPSNISRAQLSEAVLSALDKVMQSLSAELVIFDAVVDLCTTAWMLTLISMAHDIKSITIRHIDEPVIWAQSGCKHCPTIPDCLPLVFTPARLRQLPNGAYSELRRVSFESDRFCAEFKTSSSALCSIMHLPALETLQCTKFAARQDPAEDRLCAHSISALRNLGLHNCNLSASSIHDLLKRCANLEVLTIAWIMQTPSSCLDFTERVDVRELVLGLQTQQHSLRSLTLTNIFNYGLAFLNQPELGSLRHFEKLEELALEESLLVQGSDQLDCQKFWKRVNLDHILPSNLRALTFHSADYLKPPFVEVLRAMRTYHGDSLSLLSVTFPELPSTASFTLEPLRERLARNNSSALLEKRSIFEVPRVYFEYRWPDGKDRSLQKCLPVFEDS